jgi:hypothetical protein
MANEPIIGTTVHHKSKTRDEPFAAIVVSYAKEKDGERPLVVAGWDDVGGTYVTTLGSDASAAEWWEAIGSGS